MFNLSSRDRHDLHISSWSRLASFHLHLRHQSPTFHGTVVALFHMALPHLISRADDYNIVHLLSSVRISLQLLRAHREMPFSDPSPSVLSTLPTRRDMLTWAVYVLSAVFDLSSSVISWGLCQLGSDILPRSRSTLSSSCVHPRGLAGNTFCVSTYHTGHSSGVSIIQASVCV